MKKIDSKIVLVAFVLAGMLFLGASAYVADRQAAYVAQIKLLAAEQETTLATLAQTIDRGGADAVVASLIKDCEAEKRTRFDTLLSNLDTLTRAELQEVDGLFDACGDYYAQRRAVMVARLGREFEVYRDYVSLLAIADKRTPLHDFPVETWTEVVDLEKERSTLTLALVSIQDEIISLILSGTAPDSEAVRSKVIEAAEINDTLSYIGIQIDSKREAAIGL